MSNDNLQRMKSASTKAYYDMIVSELSNRIEIPLGFDFSVLQSLKKGSFIKKGKNFFLVFFGFSSIFLCFCFLDSIFGANLTFEGICQMNQLIDHICLAESKFFLLCFFEYSLMYFLSLDIEIEGLFRKSGSKTRQAELVEHLSHGNLEIDLTDSTYSIHDVCCVLKRFISELPEPLLTETLTDLLFETLNIQSVTHQVDVLRLLILLLPESNQTFIKDLFRMFDEIVKNSSKNLMTSSNLSTIFAPMFFFTAETSAEKLKDSLAKITNCLKLMIDNLDKIFIAPDAILDNAKKFIVKWNASNKLISTTSLIPHTKMCATTVQDEPSDYTKQQVCFIKS